MDPITMAIVAALGKLGEKVINDSYDALKAALQHKYGVDSEIIDAVDKLEKKPTSNARKEVLKEEVEVTKANQDSKLVELAQTLLEKLDELQEQPEESIVIKQEAGDNAIQVGQTKGDVNIKR